MSQFHTVGGIGETIVTIIVCLLQCRVAWTWFRLQCSPCFSVNLEVSDFARILASQLAGLFPNKQNGTFQFSKPYYPHGALEYNSEVAFFRSPALTIDSASKHGAGIRISRCVLSLSGVEGGGNSQDRAAAMSPASRESRSREFQPHGWSVAPPLPHPESEDGGECEAGAPRDPRPALCRLQRPRPSEVPPLCRTRASQFQGAGHAAQRRMAAVVLGLPRLRHELLHALSGHWRETGRHWLSLP